MENLSGCGWKFQQETKYFRPFQRPEGPARTTTSRIFSLPSLPKKGGPGLWQTLAARRSVRNYDPGSLPLSDLATLLWASQGITAPSPGFRTAPSAGALHPIDTYLAVNRVAGLEAGIYFFRPEEFVLEERFRGDFSGLIGRAALEQQMARQAAVVFVWVAVVGRSSRKYRERAYRYIYLDCGHIGQNLYLAATALDLGCCGMAAFYDDEINELVGVDGRKETALYLAAVGRKS